MEKLVSGWLLFLVLFSVFYFAPLPKRIKQPFEQYHKVTVANWASLNSLEMSFNAIHQLVPAYPRSCISSVFPTLSPTPVPLPCYSWPVACCYHILRMKTPIVLKPVDFLFSSQNLSKYSTLRENLCCLGQPNKWKAWELRNSLCPQACGVECQSGLGRLVLLPDWLKDSYGCVCHTLKTAACMYVMPETERAGKPC